ncbi:MAG: hypothetical protein ACI90V_007160, partial [Bacillariaceae sp.]
AVKVILRRFRLMFVENNLLMYAAHFSRYELRAKILTVDYCHCACSFCPLPIAHFDLLFAD